LATTHYMDEAEYCNTIGMMYQGQLIAVAEPDDLRRSMPGHLVQMECARPGEAETILDRLPGVIDSSVHGAYLHVILDDLAGLKDAEAALVGQGIEVTRAEKIQPSLEDVFIALVAKHRAEGKSAAQ